MKKVLSLVLVLVLVMSVAFTASAADGATVLAEGQASMPSLDGIFNAFADFLKLESIMGPVNQIHAALDGFYRQFDVWLRALGVVLNGILSGVFAG